MAHTLKKHIDRTFYDHNVPSVYKMLRGHEFSVTVERHLGKPWVLFTHLCIIYSQKAAKINKSRLRRIPDFLTIVICRIIAKHTEHQ